MKKILSVALVLCIMLSVAAPVFASTDDVAIAPLYTYIFTIGGGISINSLGVATCEGFVTSISAGGNGKVTVTLQRYENSAWNSVKSWTVTGKATCTSASNSYAITKGYNYRVYVTGTVYNTSGTALEAQSYTSPATKY